MDSVMGEDPSLPLDLNSSTSIPRLPDDAVDEHNDVAETAQANFAADGLSPVRARTMKDYENQITDLKKENFNLKLRIYFLEERLQQQFANSYDDIYRTNIELKVELESLKQDLHTKQKLLIKASKAVESLSGNRDNEIRRVKEEARMQLQQMKDDFNHRITLLEKVNKASKEEMEKAFVIAEQEKIRNMDLQKELDVLKLNLNHSAVPPEIIHCLQEKDRLVKHLQQALHNKDATIEQLKKDRLLEDVKNDNFLPEKIQELTNKLAVKESEVENLTEKQKVFNNLEVSLTQTVEELENTKATVTDLQGKLGKAEDNNKTLQMKLKEMQDEVAAEKVKSLKRDKVIQGLSLALKRKEKEVDELCHEIEERDGALAKAREAVHEVQIQKFQGAEEQQSLLMEKATELVKLHAEHNASLIEIRKLQRFIETKDHELNDLQQAKDQLEKEIYDVQQQKNHGDKAINDLRNQIEKLRNEMEEKRQEIEQHYRTLLSESEQKLQSQEVVIRRLTDNLNEKERLLQEYFEMLEECRYEEWNFDGKNALLVKLHEFLREKDQALQKAVSEKLCAVEEKEKEVQCLHLAVTGMERELERMKNTCSCKEETINRLDGMLKEKDAELSHLVNSCKNLEKVKVHLEESGAHLLQEKEEVIAQLQKSLSALKKDMEGKMLHMPFVLPLAEDTAHKVWEDLKVTEKLLEQGSNEKEHSSSSNKKDMEELLNASRKKDELLKEIETKLGFVIHNSSREIEDLKCRLAEKEQEIAKLQHLYSASEKQDLELAQLKAFLEEKDKILNKLIESKPGREITVTRLQEDCRNSHPLELKQTIKILQESPSEEAEVSKSDVDSSELETLRNQLEEMKRLNASLHAQLIRMQATYSGFGAASETTDFSTFLGDQTSYMSICLDDDESLDPDIVNLSLRELRKKVAELLLLLKELQTANQELQDKAALEGCCVCSEEQYEISFLSAQKELLEKKLDDVVKANENLQEHLCTVSCKSSTRLKKHISRLPVRQQKDGQILKKQQMLKSREETCSFTGESMFSAVALDDDDKLSQKFAELPSVLDKLLQLSEKEVNQQKIEEELSLIRSILEECGMSSVQKLRNDHPQLQNLNAHTRSPLEEDFSAESSGSSDKDTECEHDGSLKQLIIQLRLKLRKSQKSVSLLRKQLEFNSCIEGNGGFNPDLIAMVKQTERLKALLKDATVKAGHAETKLQELAASDFSEILENNWFKAASAPVESEEQLQPCSVSDVVKPVKSACSKSGLKSRLPVPVKQFKNIRFTLTEETEHVNYHMTNLLNEGPEDNELESRALLEKLQAAEATIERLQERLQHSVAQEVVTTAKKCEDSEVQVELLDLGFGNIEKKGMEAVIGSSGSQVIPAKEHEDEFHVDLLNMEYGIIGRKKLDAVNGNKSNQATKKQEDIEGQVNVQELGYEKQDDRAVQVDRQELEFAKWEERETQVYLWDLGYQKQDREIQVDLQELRFEKQKEREVTLDLRDLGYQKQEDREVRVDLQDLQFEKQEEREVQVDLCDLRYTTQEDREVHVDLKDLEYEKQEEKEVEVDLLNLRYVKQEDREVQVDLQDLGPEKQKDREVQVNLQNLRYEKLEEREVQVDLWDLGYEKQEDREVQVDPHDFGYENREEKVVQADLQVLGCEIIEKREMETNKKDRCSQVVATQKREDREVQVNLQDLGYEIIEKQETEAMNKKKNSQATKTYEDGRFQGDLQDFGCEIIEKREMKAGREEKSSQASPKLEDREVQVNVQDLGYEITDEIKMEVVKEEKSSQAEPVLQLADEEIQVDLQELEYEICRLLIPEEDNEEKTRQAESLMKHEDKEVQVDLQDLGYETCEKSETEVDRGESGSLDNDSPILQHHVSDSDILASLKKSSPWFLSMENIEIDSSTSYPSSHSLVSSKISLKNLETFDESDLPNDPAQLKEWINELKFQVEKYQKLMQHLKNAIAKKSLFCDQVSPSFSYFHQAEDQVCTGERSICASPKEVIVDPVFYSRHSSFCSDKSSRQYEGNNLAASVSTLQSRDMEGKIKAMFSPSLSNEEMEELQEVNQKMLYSEADTEKEESSVRAHSTSAEKRVSASPDAAAEDVNFFRRLSSFSDSSATNDKCRMNAASLALQHSDCEDRLKTMLSSSICIKEEEIKKLKHHILDLEADLEKEKNSNTLLSDQLQQLQARPRTASPIRYDSLVQSQARELSHFREQIKQSRNLCDMHCQQLKDVTKSFEELLQISNVEYYAAEGVREQLDQCVQLADKLTARLDNDWSSDSDDGEHIKLLQSPRHLKHQVSYLQKQLESERKRMQKHLSDLAQQKQALSTTFIEQIERLTEEVQEKNKTIFQLQLRLRSQSPASSDSHASLDSFPSDRSTHGSVYQPDNSRHIGEHCFLGQYPADVDPGTLPEGSMNRTYKTNIDWKREPSVEDMPPQPELKFYSIQKTASADSIGRNPVLSQVYHGNERKCEDFESASSALSHSLLKHQQQNSVLQEKLKQSEELNKTLKTELDLHRSILLNKEEENATRAQSILSGSHHSVTSRSCEAATGFEAQEKSSAVHADLLVEHLKEIRALRQHLEESIRTNERLRQQLEQRVKEAETDPGSAKIFTGGSEQCSHLTSEINFLKEQNQSLKEQTLKMSKVRQKENDKLKEALSKKRTTIDHLRNETESSKRELHRVQKMVIENSEENKQLKNELHLSREEIKQLQHELNMKIHQLGENQQVLQSLQLELRVYEQMTSASSKKTVSNEGTLQKCAEEPKNPVDLSELLAEIRSLRIQLELSIQANNALRQKLEEQLQNRVGTSDEPVCSGSTININCLLTRRQRRYIGRNHHGVMCDESDTQDNQGNKCPTAPKYCGPLPEKIILEYGGNSKKKMPAKNEETDSTSQYSTHTADSEFETSSCQVPEQQLWVDRNGCHVLGLFDDYSALCKCISEGCVLIHDMESHFEQYSKTITSQGSGIKLTDQGLMKSLSSNFNVMQTVLEEASGLLKLLWRVSLPPNVMQLRQDDKIRKHVIKLHKKLSEQEKVLRGTVKQLHTSNQLKENMEKIIIEQLTVTHGVLKKARGNLEMQPSENMLQMENGMEQASCEGNVSL